MVYSIFYPIQGRRLQHQRSRGSEEFSVNILSPPNDTVRITPLNQLLRHRPVGGKLDPIGMR